MTSSAISSETTTSISTFGSRLTLYSFPRYIAVCPFCRPCPRTSVTVMPGMFIFSNASRTSSTLFGRTTLLISFIGRLQGPSQCLLQRQLIVLVQLTALLRHVQHVDGLAALGRNQHEIHVASLVGHRATDAIQQPGHVRGHDFEHG